MKKTDSRLSIEKSIESTVPHVDCTIDHDNLVEGARNVITSIKPFWPKDMIRFRQFHGGTTNKLMLCYLDGTDEKALVRVFGKKTEYLIDREQEMVNICSLKHHGIGPEVFGKFNNGYCYGYLQGEPLDVNGMVDPHISSLIAKRLAIWHKTHIPGDTSPMLFNTLERWMSVVPEVFPDPVKDQKYHKNFDMNKIKSELQMLKGKLLELNSPVIFAHNDLLCKNILYHAEEDVINFIDYEYAYYSFRGFDIGNHFCEFAGMDEPVDYTRYPSRDFQFEWLRSYLSAYRNVPACEITHEEIEKTFKEVNKFALAAHFYWGSWALIQAAYSDIDFDFLDYALIRFNEYYRRRDEFLSL